MGSEESSRGQNSHPVLTEGIGKRISEVSGWMGGKKGLADLVGLSEAQMHRIISGGSQPKAETAAAIAKQSGVSLEWLLTGREVGSVEESGGVHGLAQQEWVALIPVYDRPVSGDDGHFMNQEQCLGEFGFPKDWLSKKGLYGRDLVLVTASGDSMEPLIGDGDLLLVDMGQRDASREGVFVVRFDDHLAAKRLQPDFIGGIYIKSENPSYETIHLGAEKRQSLDVIGRVVWAGIEFD